MVFKGKKLINTPFWFFQGLDQSFNWTVFGFLDLGYGFCQDIGLVTYQSTSATKVLAPALRHNCSNAFLFVMVITACGKETAVKHLQKAS